MGMFQMLALYVTGGRVDAGAVGNKLVHYHPSIRCMYLPVDMCTSWHLFVAIYFAIDLGDSRGVVE